MARRRNQPESMEQSPIEKLTSDIRNYGVRYAVFHCLHGNSGQAVKLIRNHIDALRDPVSSALRFLCREKLVKSRKSTRKEQKAQYLPRNSRIYKLTSHAIKLAPQLFAIPEKELPSDATPPTNMEKQNLRSRVQKILAKCSDKKFGKRLVTVLNASINEGRCKQTRLASRCGRKPKEIASPVDILEELGALTKEKEGGSIIIEPTQSGRETSFFIKDHPRTHHCELLQVFENEQHVA